MLEREYRALYEALRQRALHEDPGVGATWFTDIMNQLNVITRMVDEDSTLSKRAKLRLAAKDTQVLRAAIATVHAAVMNAAANMLNDKAHTHSMCVCGSVGHSIRSVNVGQALSFASLHSRTA
jgi:hypothetical protein